MKKLLWLLFIFPAFAFAQPCKEVIGYYPNWQWYDRAKLVNPMTIDYSKYSIINYAFFNPTADGNIVSTDTWADENLLQGPINWSTTPATHNQSQSIVGRCHANGVKILISVGGWTLSNNFPSIAANATKRATFASSCRSLVQTYDLDGIDIDWEYPGYAPHGGGAADKQNFTLLLQQVRDTLTAHQAVTGKTYILTACVGASQSNMTNVEWNNVKNSLDIINLMSYDFFGTWDATTNHNAPLYAPAQGDPNFNISAAVSYLMSNYAVPANKLAAGVAFYGRSAKTTGAPGLHVPSTGAADNITFQSDEGSPLYYNILSKMSLFTQNWDNTAQVPYLTGNGSLNTFLSYDNQQSIGLKANYIKNNNLRGAIIWEITGDYVETTPGSGIVAGTPLVDTLNSVFCGSSSGGGGTTVCNIPTNVTATPSSTSAAISWSNTGATAYELQYKLSSATTWTTETSSTNSFALANLICATSYDVKVKSICNNASSAYSSVVSFTTTVCSGGGSGGGGTSSCTAPSTFFFDPQTYIPLGEIKVGQGRVHPVWAVSVDAYIPTNRLNWAISNVHAAHLFRNIAKTDKIPADFYFATSFKESFCGCDAGMQAAPPNSAYPFTFQSSSLLDGCFQIENNSAYNELINLYPQRFPVGQHPNLIGNHNYETAALSKAYYDIFAVKFWEIHKGWNPKDFFNNATDINAAIKLMAVAYNRGLWYPGLQNVLQTDRANAITATTISPYFADNSYGYDYQNALTQYVQVLGNQANLLSANLTATNPATNLPYNYFGSYYDPQVSWIEMNSYIDSIAVMYPQIDVAAAKSAIQTVFNGINSGNPISFRYQLGAVLNKLILVFPADDPTTNIATIYGCAVGTTPTNTLPTITLTSPANNSTFIAPASINLAATASDADGTVTKVQFYRGTTLIGEDLTSPYTFTWSNVAAGTYVITAKATDNLGATTTSATVTIVVNTATNTPPTVTLTSPTNNSNFTAPATVNLAATAADANGTVTKVQFYRGTTLIGQDLTSPYTFTWSNVAAGTYVITAKATDNLGATTTSAAVTVVVNTATNTPPTVTLTSPTNNSTFTAPTTVNLAATAADANGTVTKVQFYRGTTLIGQDLTSPYTFTWSNVAAGTYVITAKATDNLGATTTSAAVTVVVNTATNTPPTVTLTSPTNNSTFTAPATVNLAATAADANGTVTKVQFYRGTTLIGQDLISPYTFTWSNVAAGTYIITAKATDNQGATTTSAARTITVTSTTSGCTAPPYTAGTTYSQNAQVQNAGNQYNCLVAGWCSGSQQYYEPGVGLAWQQAWSLVGPCSNSTGGNTLPQVSITSPANNTAYINPSAIAITANATDTDGTITKVAFYNGNSLLGEDLTSPYAYTLASPAAEVYTLKAIATDNAGGTTTSSIVTIVVGNNNSPCSRPVWVSTTAYVANDTISYAGVVYRAKWWTQNQNPATNSGTDGPWASLGNCGSGTGLRPNNASVPMRAGIHPNPTTEMLNILVEDFPATQAEIMVYNAVGQLVISKKYEVEGGRLQTELDLTAIPSGILTLVITASGEQMIRKVIKQ